MAFPNGWRFRLSITIDKDQIDSDLTDWTLAFDESFDSTLTSVNGPLDADGTRPSVNGGGDVRFSSDAEGNTRLAVDIRTWVTNNTPGSATCEVAVKVPNVSSSTDTTIYMWWGKSGETQPSASDTYGQYNAYDSDYVDVWPLTEGGASARLDRTSTQDSLTRSGNTDSVAGQLGNANTFDGSGDRLVKSTPNELSGLSIFTIEALQKAPHNDDHAIVCLSDINGLGWWCDNVTSISGRQKTISFLCFSSRIEGASDAWTNNSWQHVAAVSTGSQLRLYISGSEDANSPISASGTLPSNQIRVGSWVLSSAYDRDGELDEVRISDVERSAAWIAANENNQMNTSGFLTWGSITQLDLPRSHGYIF